MPNTRSEISLTPATISTSKATSNNGKEDILDKLNVSLNIQMELRKEMSEIKIM